MCADAAADWDISCGTRSGASRSGLPAGCLQKSPREVQRANHGCNTFPLSYIHLQPLDLVRLQEGDKQPPKDLICTDVLCFVGVVICSSLSPAETANPMELYRSIWIYCSVQKTDFLSVLM